MKILIFGATGMLGHKLMQVLSREHTVTGTVRRNASVLAGHPVFSKMDILGNISADNLATIHAAIDKVNPDVIINCIGIVKQLPAAQDPLQSIAINALFPHQLAQICREKNIRLDSYEDRLRILGTNKDTTPRRIPPMLKICTVRQSILGRSITPGVSPSAHRLSVVNSIPPMDSLNGL